MQDWVVRLGPGAKRVPELMTKTDKYFLFKLNKSPISLSLIAVELEILFIQHFIAFLFFNQRKIIDDSFGNRL